MALTPAAWKTVRNIIQNLLLENSELDRNGALKQLYANLIQCFIHQMNNLDICIFLVHLLSKRVPFFMFQPKLVITRISIRPFIMRRMLA